MSKKTKKILLGADQEQLIEKVKTAEDRPAFGAAVRELREALGLSREELAHRSGIHRNTIINLEDGTGKVPIEKTLHLVLEPLGVNFLDVKNKPYLQPVDRFLRILDRLERQGIRKGWVK